MAFKMEKIGVLGSGVVGRSWAMLFASAGYQVSIYDIEPLQIESALVEIKQQLHTLENKGLLKGTLTADQQYSCIKAAKDLKELMENALLIQESIPERVELKRAIFKEMDDLAGPNTILSSSTSSLMPSLFTDYLKNRANAIVSHPITPTYYVPLVEIIPAPWTSPEVSKKTREIMSEIGQVPVVLAKEIPGFALNRFQYAVLREAWHLVSEGVLTVEDIDKVMTEGLGYRYAFMGPLTTAHVINATDGFRDSCSKYGKVMESLGSQLNTPPIKFGQAIVDNVAGQLESLVPLTELQNKRDWFNLCFSKLSEFKKSMDQNQC